MGSIVVTLAQGATAGVVHQLIFLPFRRNSGWLKGLDRFTSLGETPVYQLEYVLLKFLGCGLGSGERFQPFASFSVAGAQTRLLCWLPISEDMQHNRSLKKPNHRHGQPHALNIW